jgi:hypothetical protein
MGVAGEEAVRAFLDLEAEKTGIREATGTNLDVSHILLVHVYMLIV